MGGKWQHKHWLVFAVDARVIRFSWILFLNIVTMVNLFGVRMLPLLTDLKNCPYYVNTTFFLCVYQRLILFSLLATFPLVFLLIGLVFTLTLHQLIKVNTGFGTLSLSMCVCSLNDVFDHSRASICRCTPPPPSEPHANCLSRVVSTFSHLHKLIKHQTSPADPGIWQDKNTKFADTM